MKKVLTTTKVFKGDINRALKIFKSKTVESGHLEELRERKEFKKPSVVKRKMKKDAVRVQKWADEKNKDQY